MPDQPLDRADLQPAHLVTASVLVRQFGVWQERAAQAPVYILHRGRPRLALLSVAILEALIAPTAAGDQGRIADVLDAIPYPLVLLDAQGRIAGASAAARAQLNTRLEVGGSPLSVAGADAPALGAMLARVLASGTSETAEITAPRDASRRIALTAAALPSGLVLSFADATLQDEHRELRAIRDAEVEAKRVSGAAAVARITLRGYLADPDASLVAMTAVAAETLATARFVSLFDVATRVDVGAAIEHLIDGAPPKGLSARLLVNRGDPLPVRVGLAPIRRGAAAIEGLSATIVRIDGNFRDG